MTTELTITNPTGPLATMDEVRGIAGMEIACMMIGRQIPGELDEQQQLSQGRAVIEDAVTYIANQKSDQQTVILGCCRISFIETLMNLASVNLKLTKSLGHAYMIPYSRVLTLMIGYRGLIQLIYRTGLVSSVQTGVVYQAEYDKGKFQHRLGTDGFVHHESLRDISKKWDDIYCSWMVADTLPGGRVVEVTWKEDLDKMKAASGKRGGEDSPVYLYWPGQMARKGPMRRGSKSLPMGTGMAAAILGRAWEIENADTNLDRFHAMKKVESRKLDDEAAAALGGKEAGPDPTPTDGTSPPPVSLRAAKQSLLDSVAASRAGCASSLTDIEFCEEVIFDVLGKNVGKITSHEDLAKVRAAVDSGAFDWDTATRIPEAAGAK